MAHAGKYQPLFVHLLHSDAEEVILTFAQLEELLGAPLPRTARTLRGWWSNRRRGSLQAAAWMEAGYHVEDVALDAERVTWRKAQGRYTVLRVGDTVVWDQASIRALREHMDLSQAQLAEVLGMRQQTVSEWETGAYAPTRASAKHLTLVAEKAGFLYAVEGDEGAVAP